MSTGRRLYNRKPHNRMWSCNIAPPLTGAGLSNNMVARPSTCREALKVTSDPFHQMLIKHAMENGEIKR